MTRTIAAICLALTLATVAGPASARVKHHRHVDPAPQSHIDSGWGPPSNWNEIEISHSEGV
jgi:hypothetical protein